MEQNYVTYPDKMSFVLQKNNVYRQSDNLFFKLTNL